MKSITYFKFLFLFLTISALALACMKNNADEKNDFTTRSSHLKEVSDWHYLGDIHNEHLAEGCLSFAGDKITTKEEGLNYFKSFLTDVTPTNNTFGDDLDVGIEEVLKDWAFLLEDQLKSRALSQTMHDALLTGVTNGLIDNFEKDMITDFLNLANQNYTFEELNTFIDEKIASWEAQRYTQTDNFGTYSGMVLAISKKSTEWWLENLACLPEEGDRWVFLAKDAVGAAIGVGAAIIAHEVNGGSTATGNAITILTSAVVASTGLLGKGVKLLTKLWP